MDIYWKFERLLKERGVNANQVSKATGISTATLTYWKQGKYTPKVDKLAKIKNFFGLPVSYFLGD